MEIKYAGPKPIISHTGVEFDNNKEDKYAYLNIVVQLMKALSHTYHSDRTYTYEADTHRLNDIELMNEIKKICPNLKQVVDIQNHNIEDEIEHNAKRAQESDTLTEEEKIVLENNIDIMHDYMVQRSINKSVYYCTISALAELLKKDHIDHIVTPMYESFVHVLHSVQGVLEKQNSPVDTDLTIFKKDKDLFVKLQVINTL